MSLFHNRLRVWDRLYLSVLRTGERRLGKEFVKVRARYREAIDALFLHGCACSTPRIVK